jgi:hypothetical protein
LAVHLIVDNYATHKHPKVRMWLASRARYHVHYTHFVRTYNLYRRTTRKPSPLSGRRRQTPSSPKCVDFANVFSGTQH